MEWTQDEFKYRMRITNAAMPMESRYLVQDTETTGLVPGFHSVLQACYVVATDKWEELGRLCFNLKFDADRYQVSPEALATNKLVIEEHNKNALTHAQAAWVLRDFFAKTAPPGGWQPRTKESDGNYLIPMGQNPKFDVDFMNAHFGKFPFCRYDDLLEANGDLIIPIKHQHYDIAGVTEYLMRKNALPQIKLGLKYTAQYLGIDSSAAHTAEGDVDMSIGIAKIYDDFATNGKRYR